MCDTQLYVTHMTHICSNTVTTTSWGKGIKQQLITKDTTTKGDQGTQQALNLALSNIQGGKQQCQAWGRLRTPTGLRINGFLSSLRLRHQSPAPSSRRDAMGKHALLFHILGTQNPGHAEYWHHLPNWKVFFNSNLQHFERRPQQPNRKKMELWQKSETSKCHSL